MDIRYNEYFVHDAITDDLMIEEALSIWQTREDFRLLVLTRMKKEAKLIQVDLKLFYLEESNL